MSPVCQLGVALPRGFSGGWGDGPADQRWRTAAHEVRQDLDRRRLVRFPIKLHLLAPPTPSLSLPHQGGGPRSAIKGEGLNQLHQHWFTSPPPKSPPLKSWSEL
jgi:hypothetical protein